MVVDVGPGPVPWTVEREAAYLQELGSCPHVPIWEEKKNAYDPQYHQIIGYPWKVRTFF